MASPSKPMPGTVETTTPGLLEKIVEEQAREKYKVADRYRPVMSIEDLIERDKAITYLVDHVMKEGVDFGWVPGTKPRDEARPGEYQAKPTLFKAGAERACAFFGYAPHFERVTCIEEWTPDKYGEMLFYYEYRCTLSKDGAAVGEGLGSGSTWESKYRYRRGERECPACGNTGSIIKGKEQFGGGWVCFNKKGGCGAKFKVGDPDIEGQVVSDRVPNPDIPDVVNTVSKMAQKRAYVAATLTATGLSGRFTQDLEDAPKPVDRDEDRKETRATQTAQRQQAPAPVSEVPREVTAMWQTMTNMAGMLKVFAELKQQAGDALYYEVLGRHSVSHANQFKSTAPARLCARALWEAIRDRAPVDAPLAPASTGELLQASLEVVPPKYLSGSKLSGLVMKAQELGWKLPVLRQELTKIGIANEAVIPESRLAEVRKLIEFGTEPEPPVTDEREDWVPEEIGGRK